MDLEQLQTVGAILRGARSVTVMTGAGISAESGIRTFRDTMAGLWKEFDPATLATPEAFARDPETVTRWYDHRRLGCLAAEPNAGHHALAEMERRIGASGGTFTLLTQNVDGLHQRAGSRTVHELHGCITRWRCTRTGEERIPEPVAFTEFPPRSASGGLLRPCVVWFGEMLPETALVAADEAARSCEVFLTVGTSSVVYPAAGFVAVAAACGAQTIEVNPDRTGATETVSHVLRGTAGDVLPALVRAAWGAA